MAHHSSRPPSRRFNRTRLALAAVAAAIVLLGIASWRKAPATPTTPASAAGLIVVRDPVTGQLREPTAEEAQALQSQSIQSAPEPISAPDGMTGLQLGTEQMQYTVATRDASGALHVTEVTGQRNAEKLVQGGLQLSKEEVRHDR